MAKKKSGGKSSIDLNDTAKVLHQSQKQGETDIALIWAHALTDDMLLSMFNKVVTEPRGWKVYQKQAILTEVLRRHEALLGFKKSIQEWVDGYADALRNREHGDLASHAAMKGICQTTEHFNHRDRQKLEG